MFWGSGKALTSWLDLVGHETHSYTVWGLGFGVWGLGFRA